MATFLFFAHFVYKLLIKQKLTGDILELVSGQHDTQLLQIHSRWKGLRLTLHHTEKMFP